MDQETKKYIDSKFAEFKHDLYNPSPDMMREIRRRSYKQSLKIVAVGLVIMSITYTLVYLIIWK